MRAGLPTPGVIRVKAVSSVLMKRAILLGALAAAGVALLASPSRAATAAPCHPSTAEEAPCLKTPPCTPAEAPCQS
jgi:hypothetical protein